MHGIVFSAGRNLHVPSVFLSCFQQFLTPLYDVGQTAFSFSTRSCSTPFYRASRRSTGIPPIFPEKPDTEQGFKVENTVSRVDQGFPGRNSERTNDHDEVGHCCGVQGGRKGIRRGKRPGRVRVARKIERDRGSLWACACAQTRQ